MSIKCSKKSLRKFKKIGRAAEKQRAWKIELEMETITPSPITPKIQNLERIVELYDISIHRAVIKLDSYFESKRSTQRRAA
jgi:hypothetical protein